MKTNKRIYIFAAIAVLFALFLITPVFASQFPGSLLLPIVMNQPLQTPTGTFTATADPTIGAPTPGVTEQPAVCNCSGPDLDCSDFGTHNSAQACYQYCKDQGYGDIFRLDRDGDGLVCESLP